MERIVLIPAAGSGSRLGARSPKLLVRVDGRPMVEHVVTLYAPYADQIVVVVSPAALEGVSAWARGLEPRIDICVQDRPTGMLDAILLPHEVVQRARPRRVLISWCDQVAVSPATVEAVVSAAAAPSEPSVVLPTCRSKAPYIHLQRDASGRIVDVLHRREGDEMPAHGESDAGVFDLSYEAYCAWLPQYATAPAIGVQTGERNFLPFLAWAGQRGSVVSVSCAEPEEAVGINTQEELARIEAHLQARRHR